MPRDRRPAETEFNFSDDVPLPRHIVVLLILFLLLLVGGGSGIVYLSVTNQLTTPHSNTPTPPQVNSPVAVSTATPSVTGEVSPTSTLQASPTPSAPILAQGSPTATVPAIPNPYSPHPGRLVLNDPLSDTSGGYGWDTGAVANGASCTFTAGSYHVAVQAGFVACNAEATTFSDLAYQVQMTILKGDRGGLFFRQVGTQGPYYYFSITLTGSYELDGSTGKNLTILKTGTSLAIKTGLSQSNVLAVVAQGSVIDLYVNGQHLDQIHDMTSSTGLIGVAADASHQPTEVAFSNAQVWAL